ncbi:uncharacterized protein LOC6541970 [Drosophila erecta]|uniref:Ubiquitin-like domain-containing protein n=1 Tax=Drosophila erecta TaxID=7220 RepID=B3N9L4_DROER|nr:uncharacterized protein LOC6541970 [Drosophila erecta]EDV57471.1 uncharacterized protein Dere_GG24522 [Drosophila erecta]
MFVQLFIKSNREYRQAAVVRIKEDYKISDLKLVLRKHTKIPVEDQKIMFFDTVLKDEYLLWKVAKKCKADLLAYHDDALFGRIQFLDNFDRRCRSVLKDVDMEVPNEVGPQIVALGGGCSSSASSEPSINGLSSTRSSFMAPQSSGPSYCPKSDANSCVSEDPCEIKCCEDNRPPYARVMPEDRRFGVVITNEECPGECDFNCILEFLAEAFHTTQDVASLSFSQCTPVAEFDCSLLLVAEDTDSSEWLLRAAQPMCPPYRCMSFIRHFELVRCTFVVPMVVERSLCSVFHIFENQNCGLDTGKWCVMRKTPLDPCSDTYDSKVIFRDSTNFELMAYIDVESKDYIEHHCSKIKYITWHLPVEFSQGMTCANT